MDAVAKKSAPAKRKIGRMERWMFLIAFLAIPAFSVAYLLWFGIVNGWSVSEDSENWARFGDYMAGTAGSVMGFASVVLLVANLRLQRLELKEQREHLAHATRETAQQNRILLHQSFEWTIFQWINDYKQQVTLFTYAYDFDPQTGEPTAHAQGLDALKMLVGRFSDPCNFREPARTQAVAIRKKGLEQATPEDVACVADEMLFQWEKLQKRHGDDVGGILRNLYGLFKWIDTAKDLTPRERFSYITLVRTRLSDTELQILFASSMTRKGRKLVRYINKYALLDNYAKEKNRVMDVLFKSSASRILPKAFSSTIARKGLPSRKSAV